MDLGQTTRTGCFVLPVSYSSRLTGKRDKLGFTISVIPQCLQILDFTSVLLKYHQLHLVTDSIYLLSLFTHPYLSARSFACLSFTSLWSDKSALLPIKTISGFSQYALACSWPGSKDKKEIRECWKRLGDQDCWQNHSKWINSINSCSPSQNILN